MLSSGLPENIPSSFRLETGSEVTSGAMFREEPGVMCGCCTPHQKLFFQQLYQDCEEWFEAFSGMDPCFPRSEVLVT